MICYVAVVNQYRPSVDCNMLLYGKPYYKTVINGDMIYIYWHEKMSIQYC